MGRGTGTDFWSRRRASVEAEAEAERRAAEALAETERAAGQAGKSDAELLEAAGLGDPDRLESGDDFGAYLRAALPEHLKRRALRRLWTSNPVLANLDGLIDHGEDFSDAATVRTGMTTAYQVGKGMLRHVRALAETETDEAVPEAEPEALAMADAAPEEAPEDTADDFAEQTDAAPAEDAPAAPPRRHMRFAFASPQAQP